MSETVYIARLKEVDFYKIGVTKNLKARISTLSTGSPFGLELIRTIVSDEARDIERGLHDHLKDFRVKGEWFALPDRKVEELKTMEAFPKLPPYYQPIVGERRSQGDVPNSSRNESAEEKNTSGVQWSIHPIIGANEGEEPTYTISPNDGGQGLFLGRIADVKTVAARLAHFLADGVADSRQTDPAPRNVSWMCIREAEEQFGVPRATLTWACREGKIEGAEKLGNRWRFPLVTFRAWLRKRRKD